MKPLCLSLVLLLLAPATVPAASRVALATPSATPVAMPGRDEGKRMKWRLAELEGEVAALRSLTQDAAALAPRRHSMPALPTLLLAAVAAVPLAGLAGAGLAARRIGRRPGAGPRRR